MSRQSLRKADAGIIIIIIIIIKKKQSFLHKMAMQSFIRGRRRKLTMALNETKWKHITRLECRKGSKVGRVRKEKILPA
jgi:uncharacterized protein YpmB